MLQTSTMVVGVDAHNMGRKTILGMSASYTKHLTQYYNKIARHAFEDRHGKTKQEQEENVARERTEIFANFIKEALANFSKKNKGALPEKIIIYRDGIGGPTMAQKALKLEGPGGALTQAIQSFA